MGHKCLGCIFLGRATPFMPPGHSFWGAEGVAMIPSSAVLIGPAARVVVALQPGTRRGKLEVAIRDGDPWMRLVPECGHMWTGGQFEDERRDAAFLLTVPAGVSLILRTGWGWLMGVQGRMKCALRLFCACVCRVCVRACVCARACRSPSPRGGRANRTSRAQNGMRASYPFHCPPSIAL